MPPPPGGGPGLSAALSPDNPDSSSTLLVLREIFAKAKWRLALTYGMFLVENTLRLSQPLYQGKAIDGLMNKSFIGLFWYVGVHVSFMTIGSLRQRYDTRVYSDLNTDMCTRMVQRQRQANVEISAIVARSTMSRQFIEFFDRQVPMVIRSLFNVLGAIGYLAYYDPWLAVMCVGLLAPSYLFNAHYNKVTRRLNGGMHDELEREVDVIADGRSEKVREHYGNVAGWRVRLSDCEANNFAGMEFFILLLIAGSLIRVCNSGMASVGDIMMVFRYVMMFVMGLDAIPQTVISMSRLRDIARRISGAAAPAEEPPHTPEGTPPTDAT